MAKGLSRYLSKTISREDGLKTAFIFQVAYLLVLGSFLDIVPLSYVSSPFNVYYRLFFRHFIRKMHDVFRSNRPFKIYGLCNIWHHIGCEQL